MRRSDSGFFGIRCKTCGHVITVQSGEVIPVPGRVRAAGVWRWGQCRGRLCIGCTPLIGTFTSSLWSARVVRGRRRSRAGPARRTDAAKVIVSLKPEQSVRVWKEGMDGWKRPKDVAIIAQEISDLRRSPVGPPANG